MITALKPGIEKVMRIFYENKEGKFHLREIARKAKLYGQSITRYLNGLEKEGILKSEKEGNMKKYSLNKNKKAYSLLALFDVERFERLPDIRKSAISRYLDKLDEVPVFAVMFGSTSKGTFKEGSDIDLLIITNRRIDPKKAEKEADAVTALKISTFQMNYPDFIREIRLKEDPVVQSAIFSGYPILNHISYYGVLYNERI